MLKSPIIYTVQLNIFTYKILFYVCMSPNSFYKAGPIGMFFFVTHLGGASNVLDFKNQPARCRCIRYLGYLKKMAAM